MNHIIILNDGRKVEVQKVEKHGGSLKIRMLLQTSDQLKSYFADAFSTKKITEKDDGKETVYENYAELSYIKEETGGIWEVELSQTDASVDEKLKQLEIQTEKNAENLEQAIAELTIMMASFTENNSETDGGNSDVQ